MCCNLCDANLDRPGQLAAAHQGDDLDTATQSALAGTLVSSLHRLKDVDNTGVSSFIIIRYLSIHIVLRWRLLRFPRSFCQDRGRFSPSVQSLRDGKVSQSIPLGKKLGLMWIPEHVSHT